MHRSTFARLGLLAALPLSAMLFACGGGSDKKVAMDDWVADLCEAAIDFNDASDKAGEGFLNADFEDTKGSKAAFKKGVDGQKKAQKTFRSEFGKLGQPDIDDGAKVIDAFNDQFKENDKVIADISKRVADIDDDDDFFEEFLKIADDFNTPDFRKALNDLADDSDDVQDLIDEIDADEECSSVIFDQPGADTANAEPTPKPAKTAVANKTSVPPTAAAAKTTNEKWVSGICTSLSGWVADLEKANEKLDGTLKTAKDAPALKQALVDFLKAGQTETKNLQKEVGALKAPDVKDGGAIHKVFVDASAQLVTVFDNLVGDAQKVGTNSLAQTAADVDRLSQGIGAAFDSVATTFDKLDSYKATEIEKLFESRPECSGFN